MNQNGKNIVYASNLQSNYFPENRRSSFQNKFDKNLLNYASRDEEVLVGLKSLVFDNKLQTGKIRLNQLVPDLIVFQEKSIESINPATAIPLNASASDDVTAGLLFTENRDYVCINQKDDAGPLDMFYVVGAHEKFTSLNFLLPSLNEDQKAGVMHNIFLNDFEPKTVKDVIDLINYVFKNLVFVNSNKNLLRITDKTVVRNKSFKPDLDIFMGESLLRFMDLNSGNPNMVFTTLRQAIEKLGFSGEVIDFESGSPKLFINNLLDRVLSSGGENYIHFKNEKLALDISLLKQPVLMIRSEAIEYNIKGNSFDKILALVDVNNHPSDICQFDNHNPIFYKTSLEKLASAKFEIVEPEGSLAHFTVGAPTYVVCEVRSDENRMSNFSIIIDSSCKPSKILYPQNSNTDFTAKLPERLSFNSDWQVSLKALYLPSRLYNIYMQKCWMSFIGADESYTSFYSYIPSGHYETEKDLAREIGNMMKDNKKPFKVSTTRNGRTVITSTQDDVGIVLSPTLAHILGFTIEVSDNPLLIQFGPKGAARSPPYPSNMNLLLPKTLVVTCDVVEDTIFGGERVNLLRMVTNKQNSLLSPISSFEFIQDEWKRLRIKDFEEIHCSVLDTTGELAQSDSQLPAVFLLEFRKQSISS